MAYTPAEKRQKENKEKLTMQTDLPQTILSKVIDAVHPAAVFQLGHCTTTSEYKNAFTMQITETKKLSLYHLLVLINENQTSLYEVQDRTEALSGTRYGLVCWALRKEQFCSMLNNAEKFAVHVCKYAKPLYSDQNFNPTLPPHTTDTIKEENVTPWLTRAQSFLTGAELFILRKDAPLAAFMLHQCAEQVLTAIVLKASAYRPATHNIAKLHSYAALFMQELDSLFLNEEHTHENLLLRLQKAYTDTRYAANYTCSFTLLENLFQKLSALCTLAADFIKQKQLVVYTTNADLISCC